MKIHNNYLDVKMKRLYMQPLSQLLTLRLNHGVQFLKIVAILSVPVTDSSFIKFSWEILSLFKTCQVKKTKYRQREN